MSTYSDLTTATACRALSEAGFCYPAEALTIDAREERWVVSLPDGCIAWFAASEAGARRLAVERSARPPGGGALFVPRTGGPLCVEFRLRRSSDGPGPMRSLGPLPSLPTG
jgi:hypothetical protein